MRMATVLVCVAQCPECDVGGAGAHYAQLCSREQQIVQNRWVLRAKLREATKATNKTGGVGRKERTRRLGEKSQQWQDGDKNGGKFHSETNLAIEVDLWDGVCISGGIIQETVPASTDVGSH
jgi:hypothetical protein